jgi:predicted ester cyclase
MSTEQNKAVVRRFITEVLSLGNAGVIDELLAPNYVNRAYGTDREGFKPLLGALKGALPDLRVDIQELVAEGDAVVARFTIEGTNTGSLMGAPPTGKKVSARGLTYYRLANGKIVEDDPISTPDLTQALGIQMPAPPGH